MRLIDADAAIEALNEQIEQCNKALGSFDISMKDEYAIKVERALLEAYKERLENLPSAHPDTTTHDSIPAETGKNDGDGTSGDCISRQQAIDALLGITAMRNTIPLDSAIFNIKKLPSIQPDIIHCKDCEYLCNEDGLKGMCWHINGFGTDIKDKYNSFCSWAERRE